MTRFIASLVAFGALVLSGACSKPQPAAVATPAAPPAATSVAAAAPAAHVDGVDWQKGDVDAAFAQAKAADKPLFLYWGAVWCPPCNQVKATIFTRPDFIERSRGFVPVYVDGDTPAAQKLGARFHVVGYPTMVVFKPDGSEVTRLPGEIDAQRYLQVLDLGLHANRSVKEAVTAALAGTPPLSPAEWRLLSYYSWDTDEQSVVPEDAVVDTLQKLAAAAPADQAEVRTRLRLRASIAQAEAWKDAQADAAKKGAAKSKTSSPKPEAGALELVQQSFGDAATAHANVDLLIGYAADLAGFVTAPKSKPRAALVAQLDRTLDGLSKDSSLGLDDRINAVDARVGLAKLEQKKDAPLPAPLLAQVRDTVKQADQEAVTPYQRQAAINDAGNLLVDAGLMEESDALYRAELARSHQPYYFMLHLAGNAKARGDKAAALDWYAKAYAAAEGPATRLQWGSTYLTNLIELAPQDETRIGAAAQSVFGEVNATPDTFYGRNLRSLSRATKKLEEWNATHAHDALFATVSGEVDGVCAKLPQAAPERASCEGLLKPATPAAAAT